MGGNGSSQKVHFETYFCIICNIKVPNIYWKLHNDSLKHKTCLEIANVSMRRVTKNMLAVPPKISKSVSNYYFCEACAVPIAVDGKIYHISSKRHADSVKYDELLTHLLKIYNNKSNFRNTDIKISILYTNNDATDTRQQTRNFKFWLKKVNITSEDNIKDKELSILKEHIDYINIMTLESKAYFYILKNKYLHVAIVDHCFHIDIRDFNGISGNSNRNWRCLLCEEWFNTEADITVHCQNTNHLKNITSPLCNKQCLRKCNAGTQPNKHFFHCIVCNVIMSDNAEANSHIDSPLHIVTINRSLIYINNVKSDIIKCKVCLENMDNHDFISHENDEQHIKNLEIKRVTKTDDD